MSAFEQLEILKRNISTVDDPGLLFAMNQKARQLEEEIERIKNIELIL